MKPRPLIPVPTPSRRFTCGLAKCPVIVGAVLLAVAAANPEATINTEAEDETIRNNSGVCGSVLGTQGKTKTESQNFASMRLSRKRPVFRCL
jgi:hypothetical protein